MEQVQKYNGQTIDPKIIESLVLQGDISKMDPRQRVDYYKNFCESLGLNPLTQPFQIIRFQGKEVLYAKKDATEQLRKIYGVSVVDMTDNTVNDVYIVKCKVQDKNGRYDMATGAVNIKGLNGEALANAIMKAETKSKRRATLSICGLGMLDESEVDSIGHYETVQLKVEDKPRESKPEPKAEKNYTLEAANCKTLDELRDWYVGLPKDMKAGLTALKNNRKKEIEQEMNTWKQSILQNLPAEIDKIQKGITELELARFTSLIDDYPGGEEKAKIIKQFNDKMLSIGSKFEYTGLPF